MKIFPTQNDIEIAADLLVNKYRISSQLLGELFGTQLRNEANRLLMQMKARIFLAEVILGLKSSAVFFWVS